jgi:hypothetical protein
MSARDHALGGGPGRSGAAVVRLTTAKAFDPRTRVLLEGPITATLLKLAALNVLVSRLEQELTQLKKEGRRVDTA